MSTKHAFCCVEAGNSSRRQGLEALPGKGKVRSGALIVLFIGLRVDSLRAIRDGADVTGVEVGFLADGPPDHVPADRDREAGDPHPTLLRVHHQLVGKLHQVGERRVQDWDKGDKPQRDVWRERGCLTSYDELG